MTLAIGLFVLFWLLASSFGLRRLLYWQYQRQVTQLDSEAERIREGLLQELFAVRRSLELALMTDRCHLQEVRQWLTQLEMIQRSLEALASRLAPPYLGDSLPLAIQHLLTQWQAEYPAVDLSMDLPLDWQQESIAHRQVILTSLNELLRLVMPYLRSESVLHVSLKHQATSGQLSIQLTTPNVSALLFDQAMALTNLQQFFQVLADGKCYCRKQRSTVTWCYQWRSPSSK